MFTLPVCLLISSCCAGRGRTARRPSQPARGRAAGASALLIGGNWLVYVVAVQTGHVLAASLGYYINPLVNVLLGTLFLGERLSRGSGWRWRWRRRALSLLAWGARDMLWISLSLALSFALYGLVRKLAPVGSLPGLTIETLLLLLPAIGARRR